MIKHIKPESLAETYLSFAPHLAVTKGQFEIDVPNTLADMEWNHMDQLHRPFIHQTYQEAVRVAVGDDFAISLTRWKKWPLFITVSDVRIRPGLYYQLMSIAGFFFVHFVISMEEKNEIVHLKIEWVITSHRYLKFFHRMFDKQFYKLNTRLQKEDSQIREQRYKLRKQGYRFASDPVDYLLSNTLSRNTLYPDLPNNASFEIKHHPLNQKSEILLGKMGFLIQKNSTTECLIWPSVCPHEGGDLLKGKMCEKNQIQCPWHGLRFSGVLLTAESESHGFGFLFRWTNDIIAIEKIN